VEIICIIKFLNNWSRKEMWNGSGSHSTKEIKTTIELATQYEQQN